MAPSLALIVVISSFEDRLGSDRQIGLISFNDFFGDCVPEQALDIFKQLALVNADKRYGRSLTMCTAGATDAVHVIFGHTGQLEVHHMR